MSTLSLLFPLYFTLAALFLTAIETTLFPHLGIPSFCTPDLTLALITFLASCSLSWRSLLAALGVALAAPLCNSSPGIMQPGIVLFIFFAGNRLSQTIFMNNIFPQAFFTGTAKFFMTISLGLLAAPSPPLSQSLLAAIGCAVTTAVFAFPILSYLNTLQERFQPSNPDSITS
jgi:hypothetical protein